MKSSHSGTPIFSPPEVMAVPGVEVILLEFESIGAPLLLNGDLVDIINHIGVKPTARSTRATTPRTGVKPHRRWRGELAGAEDEN
jgi:hypothetical protein